jgi:NADH-quinone oxidoreductase subunit F
MTATTLRPSELLPPARYQLAGYLGSGGHRALAVTAAQVLETLLSTSLRGLGGARFPFAEKLAHVIAHPGPRVVVCNAAEDEPGSQKDRALLERNPHLVIEGAVLAARAADAEMVVFYVRASLAEALESLRDALSEVAGDSVTQGLELQVREAPTAYVAGEASAAVRFLSGGEAKPEAQPPYPTERGLDERPTLLSNCETLANLPRIVNGDAAELTRLATVTGDVLHPGVYEVTPEDTTLADLVALAGGLPEGSVLKAIQPGGPSTAYLPASAVDTRLTDTALIAAGSSPGCLAVLVLSDQRCIVEVLSQVTAFFAAEQCGQCPPCRMKTQAYNDTLQKIRAGQGTPRALKQLAIVDDFVSDLPRRCSLISMPDAPVRSASELFPNDFTTHFEAGTCSHAQPQ